MRGDQEIAPSLVDGPVLWQLWKFIKLAFVFALLNLIVGIVAGIGLGIWAIAEGVTPEVISLHADEIPTWSYFILAFLEVFTMMAVLLYCAQQGNARTGLTTRGFDLSLMLLTPLCIAFAVFMWAAPDISVKQALSAPALPAAILFAIFVGFAEEGMFRGLAVGIFGGNDTPWFAAIASASVFALAHLSTAMSPGENMYKLYFIFGMFGLPMALVYLRTGSILGGVAVHAGWDALVLSSASLGAVQSYGDTGNQLLLLVLPGVTAAGYGAWFWISGRERMSATQRAARAEILHWLVDDEAETPVDPEADFVHPWMARELAGGS